MSLKRAASNSDNVPANKRIKQSSLLDAFHTPPSLTLPNIIASSSELKDRDSVFIAHAASISSPAQADVFRKFIRESHSADPASHEMFAYRNVTTIPGRDGSHGVNDFQIRVGTDDDGEKGGSAKILSVLEKEAALDVAIVCSRWYGGTLLGPRRFAHMEKTTLEALAKLKTAEQVQSTTALLQDLDSEIKELCLTASSSPGKIPDYSKMPLETLQRLVNARRARIKHLQGVSQQNGSTAAHLIDRTSIGLGIQQSPSRVAEEEEYREELNLISEIL